MSKLLLSWPVDQHFQSSKGSDGVPEAVHIDFHNPLINWRLQHDLAGFWDSVGVLHEARLDSEPDSRVPCHGLAPHGAAWSTRATAP